MADPAQPVERSIRLPGCTIRGLIVTPLGGDLYRLEESGLFILDDESELHSVVRLHELPDGDLEFIEVVRPSPWKLHTRAIPRAVAESPQLVRWLDSIQARGWHWERLFGGILLVHTPPDADIGAELDAVCRSVGGV